MLQLRPFRQVSEWFKEHAWKVCVLQKGTAGSNPALSARKEKILLIIKVKSKKNQINKK